MNAFKKSFFEFDSLPANPKPYQVYYIKENNVVSCYVTDSLGVPYPHATKQVILDIINSLDLGSGGTGRPFRETYKDQLLLSR